MKLIEIFADKLLQTELMEMAVERKQAVAIVASKQRTLNEHLIKYFYFEDQAKNHWLSEISSFILIIDDLYLKPKSTKLSASMYYNRLFEDYLGHGIKGMLSKSIERFTQGDYSKCEKTGLSPEQVWWAMRQFYTWLCPLLEKDTFSTNLLKNKLDELQNKAHNLQ